MPKLGQKNTKFIFLAIFRQNVHVDANYSADEDYYVKNGFWPPGGAATCLFLGFQSIRTTFFTTTFISGPYDDIMLIRTIDQMYNFSEPNCALWVTFEAAHAAP